MTAVQDCVWNVSSAFAFPGRAKAGDSAVPILILILLIVLVAQIGFWKTLGSVLGAIGVVILTLVIAAALIAAIAVYLLGRVRGRL